MGEPLTRSELGNFKAGGAWGGLQVCRLPSPTPCWGSETWEAGSSPGPRAGRGLLAPTLELVWGRPLCWACQRLLSRRPSVLPAGVPAPPRAGGLVRMAGTAPAGMLPWASSVSPSVHTGEPGRPGLQMILVLWEDHTGHLPHQGFARGCC